MASPFDQSTQRRTFEAAELDEREFDAVVRRVERRQRAERQVRALGAAWIGLSGVGLLGAALTWLAIAPWGVLSGDPTATVVLGGLGTAIAGVIAVFALPGLVAGVGLLGLRPWARALTLVLSVLSLVQVPLGTALGLVSLAVLLQDGTGRLFESPQRRRAALGAAA